MMWALQEDAFEKEWSDEWAGTREKNNYYFRVRLEKGRLDEILGSPEELLRLRHDYGKLSNALRHYSVDLEAEVIRRTKPRVPAVAKVEKQSRDRAALESGRGQRSRPSPAGGTWDEEDDQKQDAAGDDGGRSSSSSSTGEYDGRAALRNKRMIHFGF
jgi:hypothetical protein